MGKTSYSINKNFLTKKEAMSRFSMLIVIVVVSTNIIQSKSNLLKEVLKDRKKVKNIAKDVKEIKKGVKAIMDEILYVEGIITSGGLVFSENGTAFVQDHSYNHETKEAVINVPAHGNYGDNTFIMVGKNSNSPLAGKMMSVIGDQCTLHNKPEGVDSEQLSTAVDVKKNVRSESDVEIRYIMKSNHTEITENSQEYFQLPETMKSNCKGRKIFKADTEVLSEKSFKSRKFSQIKIKEINNSTKAQRQGCDKVMAACQENGNVLTGSYQGCWYWDISYMNLTEMTSPSLHYISVSDQDELCVSCCDHTGSSMIPCECITYGQAFSSAHYQLNWACMPESHYCKWNPSSTAIKDQGCDYVGVGACIDDGSCPPCRVGWGHNECMGPNGNLIP